MLQITAREAMRSSDKIQTSGSVHNFVSTWAMLQYFEALPDHGEHLD
jgi:hypothetical protein